MLAGDKTYISNCLQLIGLGNKLLTSQDLKVRYPLFYSDNFEFNANRDFLFFSSERIEKIRS